MRNLGILLCLVLSLECLGGATESYQGVMTLPIDLEALNGVRLQKGKHEIEIRLEKKEYLLFVRSSDKVESVIKGKQAEGDLFSLPGTIPIVGTHYLRSSADAVQTAQERQFSKTGLPQYAEETRSWKSTLRVYKDAKGSVFMIFQLLGDGGNSIRVDFELKAR